MRHRPFRQQQRQRTPSPSSVQQSPTTLRLLASRNGQEQFFYEDLANYCFGHYNTTFEIYKVRFDAILEDTAEKMTVILEFFTKEDLTDEMHTPDLAVCSYMKANRAFVFFQSDGR